MRIITEGIRLVRPEQVRMKQSLLRLFTTPPSWPDGPSDADLLRRFATHRDEPAFELRVRRHSAMGVSQSLKVELVRTAR